MSINAYGSGAYRSVKPQDFVSTRSQLDELQRQLATKKKSETYGGLGIERRTSLDLNAKVAKIDSWLDGIDLADVNLSLVTNAVEGYSESIDDFVKLTNDTKNAGGGSIYTPSASGRSVSQVLAESQLTQVLDLLNTNVNGRYLFSGRTTDVEPAVSASLIFEGDGARAGLKTLIAERKTADLGTGGLGRLTAGGTGTNATIDEAGGNQYYGFKLGAATSISAALAVTNTVGPPAGTSIDVVGQPLPGEVLTIPLTLPDGTTKSVVLTARAAGSTPTDSTFEVDASSTATAGNLRAAIATALDKQAKTTLAAASAVVAGKNFFAGSTNAPPLRVPPPLATTTTPPAAGTSANTMIWYVGDDAATPSARNTGSVQIGDNQIVGTGARANEKAFQVGLAQFAVFAAETFPASDTNSQARYEALAERVNANIRPSDGDSKPSTLITEFGTTQKQLANAKDRLNLTKNYLGTKLGDVENVTTEEVAVQILALQTQLEASYQTTSILSKLSLTNYL